MNGDERTPQSFSWMRRWGAALNLAITLAAVLSLVAMVNYLAIRHYARFHWNRDTEAELSSRTRQVLASLTNTIKVTVYFNSDDLLFPRVRGLLKEYQFASPFIQVRYVDYLKDGTAARKVKQEYKLSGPGDRDVVIFDAGDRPPAIVSANELSDYDTSKLMRGETNEVYRTHFKGETLFTSKIYAVANGRSPVAYYLIGNGERLANGDNPDGYGRFLAFLHDENNFEIHLLPLAGTNEIPANCNLLIIAGPTDPLDSAELEKIDHYLNQGGRALITFDSASVQTGRRTGLEKLLEKWGVEVGDNIVFDRENSISNTGADVVPVDLGAHPIVNPLRNSRLLLYQPRSIRSRRLPSARTDNLKVDELLFTGPKTVVLDARHRGVDPTQSGPKPLMAVVEKTVPGVQRGSTRLIVLGDTTVWSNQFISGADGNREFANLTANWLVNQSILLSDIPRQAIHSYKLQMTHAQLRTVQGILVAAMPGAPLLLGLLVWLRRRH
jgi:ABC-type uncharacterized transport system involved in gliding motility auxiliary subunit